MSQSTSTARTCKAGKAPARSVRLVHKPGTIPHTPDGLMSLTTPHEPGGTLYWFREVPTELEGRAFSVARVCARTEYAVHVGPHTSCECKGFLFSRRCRHTDGLAALVRKGKV